MSKYDHLTDAQLLSKMNSLFAGLVEWLAAAGCSEDKALTMTEATVAYHGESGRGSPRAVRCIETAAEYGFLKITPKGRARLVTLTPKGTATLPAGVPTDSK